MEVWKDRDKKKRRSRFVGVSVANNKWLAKIQIVGKKSKHIGVFTIEVDAAEAYYRELKKIDPAKARVYRLNVEKILRNGT